MMKMKHGSMKGTYLFALEKRTISLGVFNTEKPSPRYLDAALPEEAPLAFSSHDH